METKRSDAHAVAIAGNPTRWLGSQPHVSARAAVQTTPDRLGDVNATINAVFDHSLTEELAAADAIESKLGVDDNTNQPK
jgi:hypothetical protein